MARLLTSMPIVEFFLGTVFMQTLVMLYQYVFFRRKEFIYYILFIACLTMVIIVFLSPYHSLMGLRFFSDKEREFCFSTLLLALFMYYRFVRYYTRTSFRSPRGVLLLRVMEWIFLSISLLMFIEVIFTGQIYWMDIPARAAYALNLVFQLYLVYYIIQSRDIMNYLVMLGGVCMGTCVKWFLAPYFKDGSLPTDPGALQYLLLGIFIDSLFLNYALIYRARQVEKAKVRMELGRQEELYQQRLSISQDLHDDVGSILSSIKLYASLAERSMQTDPEAGSAFLSKMRANIRTAMENMNDVIWALNNSHNNKTLSARLKDIYWEMLADAGISFHFSFDADAEQLITAVKARKNILLIAKEAINNAIKYSGASNINITLYQDSTSLYLHIEDNGKGIHADRTGNGMVNMGARSIAMGGELKIRPAECFSTGTMVACTFPIIEMKEKTL